MPLLDYYTDTNVTARPHLVAPQGRLSAYTQADLIKQGWETVELNLLNADGNARVGSISTPLGHLGICQDQFHVLKHLHNKQSFRNGQSYPVSIDTPLSCPLTTFAIGHLPQRRKFTFADYCVCVSGHRCTFHECVQPTQRHNCRNGQHEPDQTGSSATHGQGPTAHAQILV